MNSYSPKISKILYTNFRAPVTSLRGKLFMSAAFYIYPLLPTKFNNYLKNTFFSGNPFISENSIFYKCIEKQMNVSSEIKNYLNFTNVSYLKRYRMHMLNTIFTLTSVIEYFYHQTSTFENYLNETFDYKK
jgi:hypothetical protein